MTNVASNSSIALVASSSPTKVSVEGVYFRSFIGLRPPEMMLRRFLISGPIRLAPNAYTLNDWPALCPRTQVFRHVPINTRAQIVDWTRTVALELAAIYL